MKTIIKKISLFLIAITSMIALSGCFDLNTVNELEFVNLPQSTYYKVDEANAEAVMAAYETLLGEITIKVTVGTNTTTKTLAQAIKSTGDDKVTINFDSSVLTSTGTKTIVITLGRAKLTYVFNVVEAAIFAEGEGTLSNPYKITTPQQLINIGTRVFGIPVPSTDPLVDNEAAWKYYYQFSLPYLATGKHYQIMNDLDFSDVTFRTIGSFGGMNYVPFTGVLDGQGHKILNLTVQSFSDANSLFAGLSGATVKNLTFNNININSTAGKYGAALFSFPGVTNSLDHINIVENVNVESGQIQANRAAGLAAEANSTIFKNCTVGSTPGSLIIIGGGGGNHTGGLVGFSTSRNYVYKKIAYETVNPTVGFGVEKLQELTGTTNESFTGQNYTGNTDLNGDKAFSVIIFDCTIKAYVYSGTKKGLYSSPDSSNKFFAYNSSGVTLPNNDTSVVKENLSSPMGEGQYDSVIYKFTGPFDGGTYQYQTVIISEPNYSSGTLNLNSLEFVNLKYNIDGVVTATLSPTFTTSGTIVINAYYYNSQGGLLGIYSNSISSVTHTMTYSENNRILTYIPKE